MNNNHGSLELHDMVIVAEDGLSEHHQKIRQYVAYHKDNPAVTVSYTVQYALHANSFFDTAQKLDHIVTPQLKSALRTKYFNLQELHKSRDTLPPEA